MVAVRRGPAFWPLILTGLALCLICAAFWLIWSDARQAAEAPVGQREALASLEKRRQELAAILALPPCEAKERLAGNPAAPLPEPGAAPAKEAASPAEPEKSAAASPAASKVEAIENACVFVVSGDGKSSLATGSGFFVAPGHVLTNRHVVEGGKEFIMVTGKGLGHPARARLLAMSKGGNADYALLRVDLPPDASPQRLPFAKTVSKTEKVGAWGFPNLVGQADPAYRRLLRGEDFDAVPELSYSEGVISAVLNRTPRIIVHTAPISPGNSGGPLLNEAGEVVGINTMITLDEASYRQASLALAASDILAFLAQSGINP